MTVTARLKTHVAAIIATTALLLGAAALVPGSTRTAHADTTNPILYNGQNPSSVSATNEGISQTSYIEVNGTQSNTEEGSNPYLIIDNSQLSDIQSFNAVFTFTNTGSTDDTGFNTVLLLPQYQQPNGPIQVDGSKLADPDSALPIEGDSSKLSVGYSSVAGAYPQFAQWKSANTWESLIALQAKGTLKSGKSFTVKVPLKVSDPSQVDVYDSNYKPLIGTMLFSKDPSIYSYDYNLSYRLANRLTGSDGDTNFLADVDEGSKQYLAVTKTSDNTYSLLPEENGKTNPAQTHIAKLSSSDFTVENLPTDNCYSSLLYTGSSTSIDLAAIKKSIAPYGYSVEVANQAEGEPDAASQLATSYYYTNASTSIVLTDANGNVINDTSTEPNAGSISDTQYVGLREVVRTHDVTIEQNSAWSDSKVLDFIKNHAGSELSADQLADTSLVTVTSDVDPTTPGTYKVTYTYVPDGVSETANVTVTAKKVTPSTNPNSGSNGSTSGSSNVPATGGSNGTKSAAKSSAAKTSALTPLATTGSDITVPAALIAAAVTLGAASTAITRRRLGK